MAYSVLTGRKHRTSADSAYHELDIMHGFHDASRYGKHYYLKSICKRHEALGQDAIKDLYCENVLYNRRGGYF